MAREPAGRLVLPGRGQRDGSKAPCAPTAGRRFPFLALSASGGAIRPRGRNARVPSRVWLVRRQRAVSGRGARRAVPNDTARRGPAPARLAPSLVRQQGAGRSFHVQPADARDLPSPSAATTCWRRSSPRSPRRKTCGSRRRVPALLGSRRVAEPTGCQWAPMATPCRRGHAQPPIQSSRAESRNRVVSSLRTTRCLG